MAITINGTGTITGISAGGLPDGVITSDDLASGAITAAGLPAGSILQVQSKSWNTHLYSASTSYVDIESLAITPTSSTNRILIVVSLAVGKADNQGFLGRLLKDDAVFTGGAVSQSSHEDNVSLNIRNTIYSAQNYPIIHLDTAGGTNEITYKIQGKTTSATYGFSINRTVGDSNSLFASPSASSITLIEVAA